MGGRTGRVTCVMFLNRAMVGERGVGTEMSPARSSAGSRRFVQVMSMLSVSSSKSGSTSAGVSTVR